MVILGEDISCFEEMYEGWKIFFLSVRGNIEEERIMCFL